MAAAASGQPARLRLHLTLQSRDANASPQPDTGNMYANQPGTMFPFFKKQKKSQAQCGSVVKKNETWNGHYAEKIEKSKRFTSLHQSPDICSDANVQCTGYGRRMG
jgi:hypothetical protein